ncbi:MAG: polysaccharide deacetylase family protein [Candidatus Paceibacterota bacterium]
MNKIFISGASILAIATVGGLFFLNQIKFVAKQPVKLISKISAKRENLHTPTPQPKNDPIPKIITFSTTTELIDLIPKMSNSQTEEAVRVPIFVYHSVAPFYSYQSAADRIWTVTPEVFEQQIKYLKDNGYTTISFADLDNRFASSTPLPPKPVILSFDDGWKNQYLNAYPILKKYGLTATFFVFTNAVGHPNYFSWDELREIQGAGMTIGDHSMYHPYLFKINDEKTLEKEIVWSKKILENNLGKRVDDFCYPFGHVSNKSLEIIRAAGYKTARTNGYAGSWYTKDDLYTLRSFNAQNDLQNFISLLNSRI